MEKSRLIEVSKKLKPCPFCGNKVEIEYNPGSYGYTPYGYYIKCKLCCIGFSKDGEQWEQGRGHYDVSKDAINWLIEKWNTRHDSSLP